MGLGCFQLSGGYKSYRKHVREQLESFSLKPGLVVLHGLTGSGKTELLKQFKDSLDLEGLARHRSSVYGAVGLFPHTQKMFESLLLQELQRLSKRKNILIEGESRKIGNIIMPGFLFSAMKRGVNVRVGCTLRSRVKRLASIYADSPRDVANVREITKGLESRLGKKTVSELLGFLDKGETGMFMQVLLEKYYDPLYMHSIGDLAYDISIDSDDIRAAARILRERYGLD
jgi:tRNA 2-selenouridine synthase